MRVPTFLMTLALALGVAESAAETVRPLTIVVPFARGGGAAFVAQQLADVLPAALRAPVTLRYQPGDDGLVAVDAFLAAPPDGETLLLGSTSSLFFAPLAKGRMPLDPIEDFEPVALVASVPRMVVVHPSLDVRTLDQLIRLAREQPGALPCGTSDQLSQHAVRLFERQAGVKLDCVHYAGGNALRTELLSGRRKVAFESLFLPEIQAGQLRALAVAAPGRMRVLPELPTTSESGLPGVEAVAWHALLAPRGTPRERLDALTVAVGAALRQPKFVAALEARGYVVRPMSGLQMRQYLQRDIAVWRRSS
jgi:tripartite-type tricarboxylate transporter receptor subunit TctC